MAMTIKDVAEKAGVCLVTASRALNRHPSVRVSVSERVLKAAREMDYTPNLMARALAGNSSDIVSILVSKLYNPYFGALTERISLNLNKYGICSILCDSPEKNGKLVRSLSTRGTFMISNVDPELIRDMASKHPTVGINCVLPDDVDMTSVEVDFRKAYEALTNAVLSSGRRKFAFLSSVIPEYQVKKFQTVRDILKENRIRPVCPVNSKSFRNIDEITSFIMSKPGSIDVIICENDPVAAGMSAAVSANRMKFKVEPLIVGCDDTIPMQGVWTVRIDLEDLAEKAVEAYIKVTNGGEGHRRITVMAEPIIRN